MSRNLSTTGMNVSLKFHRGGKTKVIYDLPLVAETVQDFRITLDLNLMLPVLSIGLADSLNALGHKQPSDRTILSMHVQLGSVWGASPEFVTTFDFAILRTSPDSSRWYKSTGVLDVDNFYTPCKCRSFNGSLNETLIQIANEMYLTDTDISGSLKNHAKVVLQPYITNGTLLAGLRDTMEGKGGETGYYTFIKPGDGKTTLVFKTINDMLSVKPKYLFAPISNVIVSDKAVTLPIVDYKIIGNYGLQRTTGSQYQAVGYHDFDTGRYRMSQSSVSGNDDVAKDVIGSTSHFYIDKADSKISSAPIFSTGRNNSNTSDFSYYSAGKLHKKMINLSKLWITTWGTHDLYPGDTAYVSSLDPTTPNDVWQGQFTGKWLIERIVHTFDSWHRTKVLLTRNGLNVDTNSTLTLVPGKDKKL